MAIVRPSLTTILVSEGSPPTVTLSDGYKAVLMGLAAHRAIETGRSVEWSDMIAEFEAARDSLD